MKKLTIVGIGPGSYDQMTVKAVKTLEESEVIAGYTVYADLVRKYFPNKIYLTTPMKQETERCRMALSEADQGKSVAMICSGDSGIYGMSGLLLELAHDYPEVEIASVAGVTAACSGAALLGAPLCHDFAVISLSDLLTPLELIEKRIRAAAEADLAICFYNPSSKKRAGYLKWACELILEYQGPETVCGIARNIGREGEETLICTLEQLGAIETDMFSTVYIGNSSTRREGDRMITPRGYRNV